MQGERLASAETAQAAAAAVVRAAYEASSLDNLTASVVQFGWHQQQQGTPGSLRDGAKVIAAAMEKRQAKQRAEAAAKAKVVADDEIDMFA